jgi:hypothetical protein
MRNIVLIAITTFIMAGCSSTSLIATQKKLPEVYVDVNATYQIKKDIRLSVFRLNNYTDTPRAGLRAANIVEGILLAKGYHIISHNSKDKYTIASAQKEAQKDNTKYFLVGGVSEWRYKTGIDGEPAVSMQLTLYKTKSQRVVWSATGADSDWGNGSIGTTAQKLIETMMVK